MKTLTKAWKDASLAWQGKVAEKLVGRKIVSVQWMSREDADEMMWNSRPMCLVLDDGNVIFPMQDDEGNNGGAIATSWEDLPTIPVSY